MSLMRDGLEDEPSTQPAAKETSLEIGGGGVGSGDERKKLLSPTHPSLRAQDLTDLDSIWPDLETIQVDGSHLPVEGALEGESSLGHEGSLSDKSPAHPSPPHLSSSPRIIGRAAECLVMADLILQGYQAIEGSPEMNWDIGVLMGTRLVRLQVKATRSSGRWSSRRSSPLYAWVIRGGGRYVSDAFEILALVAMDTRQIAYVPYRGQQTMKLAPDGTVTKKARKWMNMGDYPFEKALVEVLK